MNLKRMTAVAMVATMVLGSTMTAFAADGAEGQGTSFDHVNKEITSVTLPTDDAVATVFNFYVDPEGLIKDAAKLTDGTAVTGNNDGVYFKNTGDTYSSTSDEVEFEGANSVDVDVTVAASIEADDNSIALVETEEELAAATTPALLMNLTVGEDVAAITSNGASAKATIEGKEDNFEVVVKDDKYAYEAKEDASGWNKTSVKLSGKTNNVDVPDGEGAMTAPKIVLTWSVAQHTDAPVATPSSMSTSAKQATISNLGDGVTLSQAQIIKVDGSSTTLTASTHYTFSNNVFAIASGKETLLDNTKYTKIVLTFSDDSTVEISIVAAN